MSVDVYGLIGTRLPRRGVIEQIGKRLELTEAGRELLDASDQLYQLFAKLEEK